MKHIFIINPAAGKYDRTEEFSGKIAAACASRGLDYEVHVSEKPGDCRATARRAAASLPYTGEALPAAADFRREHR